MVIDLDNVTVMTPNCPECRKPSRITLPREAFRLWMNGMLIQDAWPEGTADEREMLINGIHPDCFDEIMKGGDEE